ncbi:MAG TPA: ROK family protein [Patescibacteria group bacterium]
MKQYISIDVGGTNIRIGLLAADHQRCQLEKVLSFPLIPDFNQAKKVIAEKIKTLSAEVSIEGVSLALPGPVTSEMLLAAGNLQSWEKRPIRSELEALLSLPVALVHDGSASALGEAFYGGGQELDTFIYFTWGTGFGGAQLVKSPSISLTYLEPAHQIKEWQGKECTCGQRGCFEAYMGGWALNEKYDLAQIADTHSIWEDVTQITAQMLINTLMFYPTEHFIFGGGLIAKRWFLLPKIRQVVQDNLTYCPVPTFSQAKLGEYSALYGGVALFEQPIVLP